MNSNAFDGIRTFTTFAEIEALPGFLPDNPVDKGTYKELIGDSELMEETRCCCRKENGNLCAEGHLHGWVVRLVDETVTVIGRVCANNKFDVEAKLSQDGRIFNTRKLRKNKLGRLLDYLANREGAEALLSKIQADCLNIRTRLEAFESAIGLQNLSQLRKMANGGRGVVLITAISIVRYINEDGEPDQERRSVENDLDPFGGSSFLGPAVSTGY